MIRLTAQKKILPALLFIVVAIISQRKKKSDANFSSLQNVTKYNRKDFQIESFGNSYDSTKNLEFSSKGNDTLIINDKSNSELESFKNNHHDLFQLQYELNIDLIHGV